MANSQTKPNRKAVGNALKQRVQDLPLLCVEAICKFTPTSRLIRLYSTAVPLPGASWNLVLEAALERRKLSISKDHSHGQDDDTRIDALFDSSGAKVAIIKHPGAFQFSPLCEFVQSVAVPFRSLPSYPVAIFIFGPPLLPHLPNVSRLTLVDLGFFKEPYPAKTSDDKDFLLPMLKELLPQVECFAFTSTCDELLENELIEMLPEMVVLKRLDVPPVTFVSLLQVGIADLDDWEAWWRALSRLSSLRLRDLWNGSPKLDAQLLYFLSDYCTQLTHLTMMVEGELKPYLMALREFANLTVLGLELYNVNTKGMTFSEGEAVSSVSELRLNRSFAYLFFRVKGAVASLFPNVKVAALLCDAWAAEVCQKAVWPRLEKLTCFRDGCFRDFPPNHKLPLAQFLARRSLPGSVDLSPIIDVVLARDSGVLSAVYQALKSGPVKVLLLRGPLHRDSLPRLQAYIDLNSDNAKITAWKDRDLGDQTAIIIGGYPDVVVPASEFSELTDVRIVGTKEKGGDFTIRVVHQHTKKTDIFD